MTKKIRQEVYNKCNGNCAYCGKPLQENWQVDHGISKNYFNYVETSIPHVDHIDNLMPACRKCNHYKREHPIDSYKDLVGFRKYMLTFHERLARLPKNTQVWATEKRKEYMQEIADNYGITADKPFSGAFYFETINSAE